MIFMFIQNKPNVIICLFTFPCYILTFHLMFASDFDYNLVDLNEYSHHTDIVEATVTGQYAHQTINCDVENCIFHCSETLSCALSTININGTDQLDVVILCFNSFSCLSTNLLVKSSSPFLGVTVICYGTDSCNEFSANVTGFDSFDMYCVGTGSCQEVTVNLNIDPFQGANVRNHGIIHCVLPSVCDDLTLNTNSEFTQLIMYEFSRGTILNNGVGYLSTIENIECNTNRWIQLSSQLKTDSAVIQAVHNEYDDVSFPCEDVIVQCDNETVARSCLMTYEYIGSDIVETLNNGTNDTFWVNMNVLYRITCNGECEESPTLSPTSSPTRAPSIAPSISPSMEPTPNPTASPTDLPSQSPTFSPSVAPTVSPIQAPTKGPSMNPTSAPSFSPSVSPTTAPSRAPSSSPTAAPSNAPSLSPSLAPSNSPSTAPSTAPSIAPSDSPTESPTQFPTKSDAYDTYIEWQYMISGMNQNEWQFVVDDVKSFAANLSSLITDGFDDDVNIEYQYISVNVTGFNGFEVDNLYRMDWNSREEKMEFGSDVEVLSYTNCTEPECLYLVGARFDKDSFSEFVTAKLQSYFNQNVFGLNVKASSSTDASASVAEFSVADLSEAMELHPEPSTKNIDYTYHWLTGVSVMVGMVGVVAFFYQIGAISKVKRRVDTSRWSAWPALSLQLWDFSSDIVWSFDLWARPDVYDKEKRTILIAAIGSLTFIVVPYLSNLWTASKIKGHVHKNQAASTWYVMILTFSVTNSQ